MANREHNGFSHQNPSFIGAVLNLKPQSARVYLPPDANCFLSTMAHCLRAKNYVNLMVGSKHPSPVWLTPEEADQVRLQAFTSCFHVEANDVFVPVTALLHCWCVGVEVLLDG